METKQKLLNSCTLSKQKALKSSENPTRWSKYLKTERENEQKQLTSSEHSINSGHRKRHHPRNKHSLTQTNKNTETHFVERRMRAQAKIQL